jgi:hypothetical protein
LEVLGGEIEGVNGLVGPPRGKLFKLMKIVLFVGLPGGVDEKGSQGLMGSWAFRCQSRRLLFSLFQGVYFAGSPEPDPEGNLPFNQVKSVQQR